MNPATAFDRLSLALLVSSAGCTLDAGPKLVLIALVQHYNDRSGLCCPSLKTIARLSGNISERQARRHLNALFALGLVTSIPRTGRSCCYRFDVAAIRALACRARGDDTPTDPGHSEAEPRTFAPATPDIFDTYPGHGCHPTPDMDVRLTEEGTDKELGGTEARAETAVPAAASAPSPLPVFQTLKTEDPAPAAAAAPAEVSPVAALAVSDPAAAFAAATLAAVNAQRAANGKAPLKRAELLDLSREAAQAGITPQAAAEWIMAKPGRNFFRAEYVRPAAAQVIASPVELTEAGKRAQAQIARALAKPAAVPAVASIVASPSARPIGAAVTPRHRAPASLGATTGTGWAQRAVTRFVAAESVSHATITRAAGVLGLSLADLKAQRAAHLSGAAAVAA